MFVQNLGRPAMDESVLFSPHRCLHNRHLMTVVPHYWPRGNSLSGVPEVGRLFFIQPDTQLLGLCHWQPSRALVPTLILVHGLEGCSESHYMRGIAAKAYRAGLNVIRLNQRSCGGTEHLTPTLYNSGLSGDYRAVVRELAANDQLSRIWLVGYSMGGNLLLKAAGEMGGDGGTLAGVIAVCPNIDPARCVEALEQPHNWIYHRHFLTRLKARLRRKADLLPGKWDLTGLDRIVRITEFDDRYTAPDGGYRNAADYYDRAGARHVLDGINVPALIITAQDDPFIPYSIFELEAIKRNPRIRFVAPRYGGHCGFLQKRTKGEDLFWAENRIIDAVWGIW